jgi:hypothetical protein
VTRVRDLKVLERTGLEQFSVVRFPFWSDRIGIPTSLFDLLARHAVIPEFWNFPAFPIVLMPPA